ncbi:MAG: hypothetical protein RLZ12_427 [Bacillota bacterium]
MAVIPNVTITLPPNPLVGERIATTVSFDNIGDAPGFGPYAIVALPTSNPDSIDFILGTDTATYLGTNVVVTKLTLQASNCTTPCGLGTACVLIPNTNITLCAPPGYVAGDTLLLLQLPFGSFAPTQPAADINLTLTIAACAVPGTAIPISTAGLFRYGDSATGSTPIISPYIDYAVTPELLFLTKTYIGPEEETATGPNFTRQYRLNLTVAPGKTITNFQLTDTLPNNIQFVSVDSVSPVGTVIPPSTTTPGGTLTVNFASITDTGAVVIYSFFVPRINSLGNAILNASTGAFSTATNTVCGSGTWQPCTGLPVTVTAPCVTNQLTLKSIATQKGVADLTNPTAPIPGDILQYTINVQISDYFAFEDIIVDDTISDGQIFDSSFIPTIAWNQHGTSAGPTPFNIANYSWTFHLDGTTDLQFRVSQQLAGAPLNGQLLGGGIPAGGTGTDPLPNNPPLPFGPTTFQLIFHAQITPTFTTCSEPECLLAPGDVVTNAEIISAEVLNVTDLSPTGNIIADNSGAGVTIALPNLQKSIYAINGTLATDPTFPPLYIGTNGQYLVTPGDNITYRALFVLPNGSLQNVIFSDFLPLPIFTVSGFNTTFGAVPHPNVTPPIADTAAYGPTDTLDIAPNITFSVPNNSLFFNFGSPSNLPDNNTPKVIDIIFTLTVNDEPFVDGLFLTNQVQSSGNNTQSPTTITANAIIQFELKEPLTTLYKGIVGYKTTGLTLGGIKFTDPSLPAGFTPTLYDAAQATAIGASDIPASYNLQAGDKVRFAIVLQNTGSIQAYNVELTDTLPAGFIAPGTIGDLALTLLEGDGVTALTLNVDYTAVLGSGLLSIAIIRAPALGPGYNANDDTPIIDGTNTVVVCYDLVLQNDVEPGATITNTGTLTNYTSTPSGPNFVPNGQPETANVTLGNATFTKTLNTPPPVTGYVIGAISSYTLTVAVPQGVIPNAAINDILDGGLAFVSVESVFFSSGSLAATNTIGTGTTPANVTIINNGQNITYNFGTLTNSAIDESIQTVTIIYSAVVLNVTSNIAGQLLNNAATFSGEYTDIPSGNTETYVIPQATPTAQLTVVEPRLTLTKGASASSSGPFLPTLSGIIGGEDFYYQIVITNASGYTAYNTTLTDPLPAITPNLFTIFSVTGASISDFTITGGTLQTVSPLLVANGTTITIIVQGTLPNDFPVGSTLSNTANIRWSSLSGSPVQLSIYNTNSYQRTGSGSTSEGQLNNYTQNANAQLNGQLPIVSKSILATADSNIPPNNVAIGELVTYRITTYIPVGTIIDFIITDIIPAGMTYSAGSATLVASRPAVPPPLNAAQPGSGTGAFNGSVATPTVISSGGIVTFSFGPITANVGSSPNNGTFYLTYQARVIDIPSNVSGTLLTNTITFTVDGGTSNPGLTDPCTGTFPCGDTVVVAEPQLQIIKSANNPSPNIGGTLTYTLTITHTVLSTSLAYNVLIDDPIPPGLTIDPTNITVNGVNINLSPLVIPGSNTSTTQLVHFSIINILLGDSITVLFTATISQDQNLVGTIIQNTATIDWDSQALAPLRAYQTEDTQDTDINSNTISGIVYEDLYGTGSYQVGDPGIQNVILTLTGSDLNGNPFVQQQITASTGQYTFVNIPAGTYTITETQPPDYINGQTTVGTFNGTVNGTAAPNIISNIVIPANQTSDGSGVNYNFGELLPSAISGFVYYDANNSGVIEPNDKGVYGVTLILTGTNSFGDYVTFTTYTASDGSYSFDNLTPGNYTVTRILPGYYVGGINSSPDGVVGPDAISDINLVTSGQSSSPNNFALLFPNNKQCSRGCCLVKSNFSGKWATTAPSNFTLFVSTTPVTVSLVFEVVSEFIGVDLIFLPLNITFTLTNEKIAILMKCVEAIQMVGVAGQSGTYKLTIWRPG